MISYPNQNRLSQAHLQQIFNLHNKNFKILFLTKCKEIFQKIIYNQDSYFIKLGNIRLFSSFLSHIQKYKPIHLLLASIKILCLIIKNFQKISQSLGFQAINNAIEIIIEKYEQNMKSVFQYESSSLEDFASYSQTFYFQNSKLIEDLDFIEQILSNIFPNFDTFFSLQKRDYTNLIINQQYTKLPTFLNYAQKFITKLSINRKVIFDQDWTNILLQTYNQLLVQYMKYGFVIDNFEFFAQQGDYQKENFNQLNYTNFVQVEAPGCVLYPKLMPYFISENLAREVVFIARVSKLIRFEESTPNLIHLIEYINQIELNYTNYLEFDQEITKIKSQISRFLWKDLLLKNQIQLNIINFIQLNCMQNSAVFDIFLDISNDYISKPWLFSKDIAFVQYRCDKQSICEIELNGILDIEWGYPINCLRLVQIPTENQLHQDANLQHYAFKLNDHIFFDVDSYFYGVECSTSQTNFYHQINQSDHQTLIPFIVFNYTPTKQSNSLLLSPQIQSSFSKIFRNLLYIKYYNRILIKCSQELIQYKKLFLQLQQFQNKNPHFMRYSNQPSNVAVQIGTMSKIYRINHILLSQFQLIQVNIASKMDTQIQIFNNFKQDDFLLVQKQLIILATELSTIVFLNDRAASNIIVAFFKLITKFEQLIANLKPFFEKQLSYGKANDQQCSQINNLNLYLDQVLKMEDSLSITLRMK